MELGKVKSQIEKYSKENGIDVQVAWDSFFFNEFLYRVSLSGYKDKYVFKGGFYLQITQVSQEPRLTVSNWQSGSAEAC